MLPKKDQALKIPRDVIDDITEIFLKWPLLLMDVADAPKDSTVSKGYVDFEFADGALIRLPCLWTILEKSGVRTTLTFKDGGNSAEWVIGAESSSTGAISGLKSTATLSVGTLTLDSLESPSSGEITIENANIDALNGAALNADALDIINFEASNTTLTNPYITELKLGDGSVAVAALDYLYADSVKCTEITFTGEQKKPVHMFNAWYGTDAIPKTEATYSGSIPLAPIINGNASNGFCGQLSTNPFYPDWVFCGDSSARYWRPLSVWFPSAITPQSRTASWTDSYGQRWHLLPTTTNASMFGDVDLIYPPRTDDGVLPPLTEDADGLVVTVRFCSALTTVALTDRYEHIGNYLAWAPGRVVTVKGPCIAEFIIKREIILGTSGATRALEYQFLPLGVLNVAN